MVKLLSREYPESDHMASQPHMQVYIFKSLYQNVCSDIMHNSSKVKNKWAKNTVSI